MSNKEKNAKNHKKYNLERYEEERERLRKSAKIIAIVVSVAMIVTAFLSAGVFFLR